MKNITKQTLRYKLVRLTLAAVFAAMLVTVAALALFESTTFRPRALENAKIQADLLAEVVVPALEFDDAATAEKMLAMLRHEMPVKAAVLYRADGSRLAQFQRSPATRVPAAAFVNALR